LKVTDGAYGYCYSCLTDVPQLGKLGLLWEVNRSFVFSLIPTDF